jgi:osmotically-inducible protein OsmY
MNRKLGWGVALLTLLSSVLAPAQERSRNGSGTAYTGCLESSLSGFALATRHQTRELTGKVDFSEHVGHTVKITGEITDGTLTAESLEHISPTCNPATLTADRNPIGDKDNETIDPSKGPTAQDQGNSKADRETTAKIRKSVVDDDALSMRAHNITIITRDGRVTLRGSVRSAQEKAAVAGKAEAVVGASALDDQITIEPDSDGRSSTGKRKEN